jgi:hypothetical protein
MKRRQCQRSPAESGAARTPGLLHRLRDAVALARCSAHRKGDAAMETVPAIEDQLHTLQSICSAQRVSTGITCGAPAAAAKPNGDLVETLCQNDTNHPGESVRRVMTADPASVNGDQQTECGGLIGADDVPDLCSKQLDRAAGGGTRRDDPARRRRQHRVHRRNPRPVTALRTPRLTARSRPRAHQYAAADRGGSGNRQGPD